MVRQRKVVTLKHGNNNETSSSSNNSDSSITSRTFKFLSIWKTLVGFLCLVIAVYVGTLGYLETRVNTPFDNEKVVQETGLDVPERYWGSYRPGVYFGMKSREPRSPVFGLMWYDLSAASHKGIRHWCDQNDNLPSYGWTRHDGVSFGEQTIVDPPHNIVTSFVKTPGGAHGGHWTARINVTANNNIKTNFMLIWYGALDESRGAEPARLWADGGALLGHTPQLDHFRVSLVPQQGKILHSSYSEAHAPGLHLLKEKFHSLLRVQKHPTFGRVAVVGPDEELDDKDKEVNFVPFQLLVETPFVLDVVYSTEDLPTPPLQGREYQKALDAKKKAFDAKFEDTFGLAEKGYSEEDISIAKAGLSNMVGGIGYFYGAGRVQSQHTREPVPYWRAPLYTAVPSRSFFPRGFLWDEGFHGLLIGRWSVDIQMDIIAHWLDLINVEGWIPREQILGVEALARVPKEFVVQSNSAANPPMLLVQLARLVRRNPKGFMAGTAHRKALERMYNRLKAWYNWFQTTQKGEEPTSYRWRGREDDGLQLNPKTLTSGLDDYPRASHPSDIERHVDLRCWMYAAADSLALIARTLDRDPYKFESTRDELGDEDLLNELHWSPHTQTYADYGLHTDGVRLTKIQPKHPNDSPKMVRTVTALPQPRLVTSAFGYVSLFPMLMKVLRPESENLGKILEQLDKPGLLWSQYGLRFDDFQPPEQAGFRKGFSTIDHIHTLRQVIRKTEENNQPLCLAFVDYEKAFDSIETWAVLQSLQRCQVDYRSLSKSSPLYMKRNTEHDPPYWRGQVWANINYLALSALKHYGAVKGPHSARAKELHDRLRDNFVRNILSEYKRTGYLWEQYSGEDGKGSGCRPFSGWTALVTLVMAEDY